MKKEEKQRAQKRKKRPMFAYEEKKPICKLYMSTYRGILADVIVYIFAHLHRALRTEGNMLDINWLQADKELVEFNTWWNL